MKSIVTAVAAVALLVAAGRADAGSWEYGAVTINNPTSMDIHYQLKWGDGEYKSYTVEANSSRIHWYQVGGKDYGPTPRVRFDYILNDGKVTYKYYTLKATGTDTTNIEDGTQYEFKKVSPTELDLFKQ